MSQQANAEHLIERIKPYLVSGFVNPYYQELEAYVVPNNQSRPFLMRMYKIDDKQIVTYQYAIMPIIDNVSVTFLHSKYPNRYLIKIGNEAETYVDKDVDGINGNETLEKKIDETIKKEKIVPSGLR